MRKPIVVFTLTLALLVGGCESVYTYHEREKTNERLRDLERGDTREYDDARDPSTLKLRIDELERRVTELENQRK